MRHIQIIGLSLAEADAYVGASRELWMVTETGQLRAGDGVTPGGRPIPTAAQIAGFNFVEFTSVGNYGVPGNLPDASQGTMLEFSVAGTYNLPLLANVVNVGATFILHALVAGVIVSRRGADLLENQGVDVIDLNLVQFEKVKIAKKTGARYTVLSKY